MYNKLFLVVNVDWFFLSHRLPIALAALQSGYEVFGGYNKYYIGKLNAYFTHIFHPKIFSLLTNFVCPLLKTGTNNRGIRFKLRKLINSIDYDENFYYKIIFLAFSEPELVNMLNHFIPSVLIQSYKNKIGAIGNDLNDFRLIDKNISLEGDMLVKVDRTSMLTSLECRSPFLNKDIWQFTNQLPDNFLIHKTNKKYILKKSFENKFPPHFFEKPKQGFGVPIGDWLRNSLSEELLNYTDDNFLRKQNIFNIELIKNLVFNHLNGKTDNTFRIWTFFCFQKWYVKIYDT
jgi:asparagine synthase (glutamine-hydrolysing)